MPPELSPPEWGDPLHEQSGPSTFWTTVNAAEALPGVSTPLNWTIFGESVERAFKGTFCDMGVLPPSEVRVPPSIDDRLWGMFCGRAAANLDTFRRLADLTPGTSGDSLEHQIFGTTRPGVVSAQSKRRYPVVAAKMPRAALALPKVLRRHRSDIDTWWRSCTTSPAAPGVARERFLQATVRFETVMRPHTLAAMLAQAIYEQLSKLADAAGHPGLQTSVMTGYGGLEETKLMADLWAVSRGQAGMAGFLAKHGYHGPTEGEVSSRSWREDPAPIEQLAATYRGMDESAGPAAVAAARAGERQAAIAQLLGGLPKGRQLAAQAVLRMAGRYIPLREVGKAAFLQAVDVARASARILGADLAARGLLAAPDDVFYLTARELLNAGPDGTDLPSGIADQIAFRRDRRDGYLKLRLPDSWTGMPVPIPVSDGPAALIGDELTGIAVSPGVVEGRARVVLDPLSSDPLEPGEILVCETTDPSWTSLFLVAGGLVIDIGGPLSHGAIVARELGVPCVINTRTGTRVLRTGDRLRVDGDAGKVEVLP